MCSQRGPSYCSLCDMYFPKEEDLANHIQVSTRHPWCNKCSRRFPTKIGLHNHWKQSAHYYCSECSIDFLSPEGLQMHFDFSSAHCDNDNDSDADSISDNNNIGDVEDWQDIFSSCSFPEDSFEDACRRGEELTSYDPETDVDYDTDDDYFDDDESTLTYHIHPRPSMSSDTTFDSVPPTRSPRRPYTCPLCLEIPQHCASTQCGHAFCASCLDRAIELENRCPVCKTPFTTGYGRVSKTPTAQRIFRSMGSISTSLQSLYTKGRKLA